MTKSTKSPKATAKSTLTKAPKVLKVSARVAALAANAALAKRNGAPTPEQAADASARRAELIAKRAAALKATQPLPAVDGLPPSGTPDAKSPRYQDAIDDGTKVCASPRCPPSPKP